jgi:hypothetical protein
LVAEGWAFFLSVELLSARTGLRFEIEGLGCGVLVLRVGGFGYGVS